MWFSLASLYCIVVVNKFFFFNSVSPSLRTRGISLDIIMKKTRTFLLRCRAHRPRAFDVLANLHFAFLVPWHTQTILSSLLHRIMLCVSYSQCVTGMSVITLRAKRRSVLLSVLSAADGRAYEKHKHMSCLCLCVCNGRAACVCGSVTKLRASIFT